MIRLSLLSTYEPEHNAIPKARDVGQELRHASLSSRTNTAVVGASLNHHVEPSCMQTMAEKKFKFQRFSF